MSNEQCNTAIPLTNVVRRGVKHCNIVLEPFESLPATFQSITGHGSWIMETHEYTNRGTNKHTDRQTSRQAERQTDTQTIENRE